MGKRRIEQKLGLELYVLGDAFNKHCPRKGPSLHKDSDCEQLYEKLWRQVDVLFFKLDDAREIPGKAIDIALIALLLADRARRDA